MSLLGEIKQKNSNLKQNKFPSIISFKPALSKKAANTQAPFLPNEINTTLQQHFETTTITRHICCFQFKFTPKQSDRNDINYKHGASDNVKPIIFNFVWKSLIKVLKLFILVVIVCASFFNMTVILKDFPEILGKSLNETRFNESISIEGNETNTINHERCVLCYLRIWFTSFSLVFVYPIYLLVYLVKSKIFKLKKKESNIENVQFEKENYFKQLKLTIFKCFQILSENRNKDLELPSQHFDFCFKIILIIFLWQGTGYMFLVGLNLINLLDFVILYSTNYSFVYITNWIVLHKKFIPLKLVSFIVSIAAIIFILYSEGLIFNNRLLGIFVTVLSACGSATLQILWKNSIKNLTNKEQAIVASFFSLGNIFLGCPISILLHITGIESLNLLKASILFEVDWYSFISGFALASFLGLVYIFLLQFGSRKSDLIYLQLGNLLTLPLTLRYYINSNASQIKDLQTYAFICVVTSYVLQILPDGFLENCKKNCFPEQEIHEKTNSLTRRYKNRTTECSSPIMVNHKTTKILKSTK